METHLEIEAKYDVADGQQLPDLIGVGGVEAIVAQAEMVLTAIYFDTADKALSAAGATLRRRTGGTDDGWHLKLPLADGERLEVHRPIGRRRSPPVALTSVLRGLLRERALEPVATLVNRRTVHRLLDGAGRVLAELADDSVTGERHDVEVAPLVWRELEIELVDGERPVLAALDAAVRAAGIAPAAGASKVGRVLGSPPVGGGQPKVRRKTRVGEVLHGAVRRSVADLAAADPLLRLDRSGAATRMRAAGRQLRAALALKRQVRPDEESAPLRAELAWLDTVAAGLEDLDTTSARLSDALGAEPEQLVLGPVRRRVERELTARRRAALTVVREAIDSPRYLALLDDLAALATPAPAAAPADTGRAADVLPDVAARALDRAVRRIAQLRRAQSEDERRWSLSGAARAVARARSAESIASDVTGLSTGEVARALERTAAVLAELELSARTQEVLRDLALTAQQAGESGFTYGRLHGLEQARAATLSRETKQLGKQLRSVLPR